MTSSAKLDFHSIFCLFILWPTVEGRISYFNNGLIVASVSMVTKVEM